MPTPRATTVEEVLKGAPILSNQEKLAAAFPSTAEKAALLAVAQQLHDATQHNHQVEATWQAVSNAKAVVLKLAGLALGKVL